MAFSQVPTAMMAGYGLTGSTINLTTVSDATGDAAIGSFFSCAVADTLTTVSAHGLSLNQVITVLEVTTLPTGLAVLTSYYVVATPTALTFQVSATRGGAPLSITVSGTADNTITLKGMLPELTDTEAHAANGDSRDIMYSISEWLFQSYNAKITADQPNRMALYKSVSTNVTTGIQTVTYTAQYELASGTPDVADEE